MRIRDLVERWVGWYAGSRQYSKVLHILGERSVVLPALVTAPSVLHHIIQGRDVVNYDMAMCIVRCLQPVVEDAIKPQAIARTISMLKIKLLFRTLRRQPSCIISKVNELLPRAGLGPACDGLKLPEQVKEKLTRCQSELRRFFLQLSDENYYQGYIQSPDYQQEFGAEFDAKLGRHVMAIVDAAGRQLAGSAIHKILQERAQGPISRAMGGFQEAAFELLLDATVGRNELTEEECITLLRNLRPAVSATDSQPFTRSLCSRDIHFTQSTASQNSAQNNPSEAISGLRNRSEPVEFECEPSQVDTVSSSCDSQSCHPQSIHSSSDPQSTLIISDPQSTLTSSDPQSTLASSDPQSIHPSSEPQSTHPTNDPQSTLASSDPQSTQTTSDPQSTHPSSDSQEYISNSGHSIDIIEEQQSQVSSSRSIGFRKKGASPSVVPSDSLLDSSESEVDMSFVSAGTRNEDISFVSGSTRNEDWDSDAAIPSSQSVDPFDVAAGRYLPTDLHLPELSKHLRPNTKFCSIHLHRDQTLRHYGEIYS